MTYFYLGTHQTGWLATSPVPLFVSHRRLAQRRQLPAARCPYAVDSGGFSELSLYGTWRTTPRDYLAAVLRYDREIGRMAWCAPQDWMCEPDMLAKTGLTIAEHQRRTVANLAELQRMWADHTDDESPIMPVLQGWALPDYHDCWSRYEDTGIDLGQYPVVGLGSVCRRQATDEIARIVEALLERDPDLPLHGFGVKTSGLRRYGHLLGSADSMAWSYDARRSAPLPGHSHINCANCLTYALAWRERVLHTSTQEAAA